MLRRKCDILITDSFEAVENEARSSQISKTKNPNLESEVPKTRKRSTQISKTKHPRLKTRKRSTQISKTKHPKLENEAPKTRNLSAGFSLTRKYASETRYFAEKEKMDAKHQREPVLSDAHVLER